VRSRKAADLQLELKLRRVCFAGCTPNPHERWITQIALNLTNTEDSFWNGKRYLLMNRDGKFCLVFRGILQNADAMLLLRPRRGPNRYAHIERFR
jgi:hypothetical protein